ncbi:MAG: anaerobic ribonucleoside-triphosphate reductase [Oscillospiraceae bacterium]|jgi:ribonucleoside-triphosphate reductase|nr:anaerobic ribonucleoside-triphosphate reductase [Oscillospiraceae bacterium]
MEIKLNLDEKFSECLERLKNKYGEHFEIMNGFSNSHFNFTDYIGNFIKNKTVADTTIDANANSSTHDVRTLLSDMVKPHMKLLSFERIFKHMAEKYGIKYAENWLEGEWNGQFYLHDASSSAFIPYCYAYDLDKLVEKGLFFINRFKTEAPRHLTTFNDHVLEFISWASNRTSGAVGLPSYLVYSYYFWYNDVKNKFYLKNPEYYRRQCFQKFIYDLNQPYLRVTECAFSNISIMDRNYLIELFGGREFPNGDYAIDHIDGIIEHQKVFMEVVSEIRSETMMTFPVLTFSLLFQNGKFVDEKFARWCNRHNMKWFDSNFYVGNDVTNLSSCCRLISDTSKLNAFINSIGGTSLSIGSVKVNTINLRRIAVESGGNKEKYFEILRHRVDLCVKTLDVVRSIITKNIEDNLLPNYTHGLIELDKQYNTIGITAMYEAISEFGMIETDVFGNKSYSSEGLKFALQILNLINKIKDSYNFDYSINVEAIPAERANVVLCQKDNEMFRNREHYFIYSNQWIPLMEKCSLSEKVKLGSYLDKECGGGQISHINLSGDFANEEQAWDLLNYIAKSGVIYFAYNRKISVCSQEHAFLSEICPKCGEKAVDMYSRIVGFLVPFSSYSKERKIEFDKRKWLDLNENSNEIAS